MLRTLASSILVLSSLVFGFSCSPGGAGITLAMQKSVDVPNDMALLVPEGSVAYVHFASIADLEQTARTLMKAVEPGFEENFEITEILQAIGIENASLIDSEEPLGLAVLFAAGTPEPTPIVILPATDPGALAEKGTASPMIASVQVAGSYVGFSMGPDYTKNDKPCSLTSDLPEGQAAARIDVGQLIQNFRPLIDGGMQEMTDQASEMSEMMASGGAPFDIGKIMDAYIDGARMFLDSAQTLDLAIRVEDTEIETVIRLVSRDGSPMAKVDWGAKGSLANMARFVDTDASMNFLLGADIATLMEEFDPFISAILDAYPEPLRDGIKSFMPDVKEMYPLYGEGMAGSLDFDSAGMRMAFYVHSPKADELLRRQVELMDSLNESGMGIEYQGPEKSKIEGVEVWRYRATFDAEKITGMMAGDQQFNEEELAGMQEMMNTLYGEDGMPYCLAVKGDHLAMILGDQGDYLARSIRLLKDGSSPSSELERAVDLVAGGSPSMVVRMDMGRVATQMQAMFGNLIGMPYDEPAATVPSAPFLMYGAVDGPVWHFGTSFDVALMAKAMRAMEPGTSAPRPTSRPSESGASESKR